MKYWHEFITKCGFHDGGAYPIGLEAYRVEYVALVRRVYEKLYGTVPDVEIVNDTKTAHNEFRINYSKHYEDTNFQRAVKVAERFDIDKYIEIKLNVEDYDEPRWSVVVVGWWERDLDQFLADLGLKQ